MGSHPVDLEFQMLAPVGGIDLEGLAVPGKSARTVALGDIGILVEWSLDRPVMGKVHSPPARVIEHRGGRSGSIPGFCITIGRAMPLDLGERNVSEVKTPSLIEGKDLTS